MIASLKSWLVRLALRLIGRLAHDDETKTAAVEILKKQRADAAKPVDPVETLKKGDL